MNFELIKQIMKSALSPEIMIYNVTLFVALFMPNLSIFD
jgi:hypothetical protein